MMNLLLLLRLERHCEQARRVGVIDGCSLLLLIDGGGGGFVIVSRSKVLRLLELPRCRRLMDAQLVVIRGVSGRGARPL